MSCSRTSTEPVLERYLQGKVTEEEQAAFEEHFFDCEECLADVQAGLAIRDALAARSAGRAEKIVRFRLPRALAGAAAIAAAAGGVALLLHLRAPDARESAAASRTGAGAAREPRVLRIPDELLRVEPPAYVPFTVRGAGERTRVPEAMVLYQKRDFAGAAEVLRRARRTERSPMADFYLGVCSLLQNRDAEAADLLAGVASSSDAVYAGPALLYLGKAQLRLGRVDEARRSLERLASGGGPGADSARDLLASIPPR